LPRLQLEESLEFGPEAGKVVGLVIVEMDQSVPVGDTDRSIVGIDGYTGTDDEFPVTQPDGIARANSDTPEIFRGTATVQADVLGFRHRVEVGEDRSDLNFLGEGLIASRKIRASCCALAGSQPLGTATVAWKPAPRVALTS
jgi:hypothetical protein